MEPKAQIGLVKLLKSFNIDANPPRRIVHAGTPCFAEYKPDISARTFNRIKAKAGRELYIFTVSRFEWPKKGS